MKRMVQCVWIVAAVTTVCTPVWAAGQTNPFVDRWALTIPGGGAGWLGVTQEDGYLDASILWGGGSVVPVDSVFMDDDELHVTRLRRVERKDAAGKVVRRHTFTEEIVATVSGDDLALTQTVVRRTGNGRTTKTFTGKRIPPMPPRPVLSNVRYGDPIQMLQGDSLDGWTLTNPKQANGWSVRDGVLVNDTGQHGGKTTIRYGNLRTEAEFEDFNLKLDVKVEKGGNSGVYLRGIYEVQVSDSYGRNPDAHGMGGIYSRIAPSVNAEKAPGKWQTMDMTLVDRHVTVKLNGTTIIDNAPLLGCTGGALWSDELRPGPIYLQGDHTAVWYRNIVLTPVAKTKG